MCPIHWPFFTLTDRFNERYEELNNHPNWSFHGRDFPSNAELLEARNRVFARHPRTQFVVLHVGNFSENLANVAENLDKFPNMTMDIAAQSVAVGGERIELTRREFRLLELLVPYPGQVVPRERRSGEDPAPGAMAYLRYQSARNGSS